MPVELQELINHSVTAMGTRINSVVQASAIELIKRAYNEKIYVRITNGYRSNEEQARLYGQGRANYVYNGKQYADPLKPIVTNAKPGTSYHNYGLAIDYVLLSEDGKRALWNVDDKWRRVAAIGKQLGFEWGGDWRSFKDYPHLQMTGGLTITDLQSGKRPSLKRNFTPLVPKEPIPNETISKGDVKMFQPSTITLKNEFILMLENAIREGIISDSTWVTKAKNGELPLDDALALVAIILSRGRQVKSN